MQSIKALQNDRGVKSLDSLNASEQDLLAVALGMLPTVTPEEPTS
jgi:hypothetical protein